MKQIFVSNYGDDNNHGLGRSAPVKSRKRLYELCRGDTEMVLIEGSAIFERLMTEALGTGPDHGRNMGADKLTRHRREYASSRQINAESRNQHGSVGLHMADPTRRFPPPWWSSKSPAASRCSMPTVRPSLTSMAAKPEPTPTRHMCSRWTKRGGSR